LSLERIPLTSEFFNNDFGEFDRDVLFVCVSWVYPQTIKYLQKNNRNFMLISRPSDFIKNINFHQYGYVGYGPSVAHMLAYLATYLNHKNIIFIGQDLAYAENGNSHPDDYQNSANYESQMYEHILTKAYGEKEEVKTHAIWILFKNYFENEIIPNTIKMG
ncbi:motility associated factor glycosyltransferase family protein, partial [Campylobacter jejuni]|nr:motility associated factor glycosyltransferase family protein [Campylobacter jejuni]